MRSSIFKIKLRNQRQRIEIQQKYKASNIKVAVRPTQNMTVHENSVGATQNTVSENP